MSEVNWMDDERIATIPKEKLSFLQKMLMNALF